MTPPADDAHPPAFGAPAPDLAAWFPPGENADAGAHSRGRDIPPLLRTSRRTADIQRYYLCSLEPSGEFDELIIAVSDGERRRYFTTRDGAALTEVDEDEFELRRASGTRSLLELNDRELGELETELGFVRPVRGRNPVAELAANRPWIADAVAAVRRAEGATGSEVDDVTAVLEPLPAPPIAAVPAQGGGLPGTPGPTDAPDAAEPQASSDLPESADASSDASEPPVPAEEAEAAADDPTEAEPAVVDPARVEPAAEQPVEAEPTMVEPTVAEPAVVGPGATAGEPAAEPTPAVPNPEERVEPEQSLVEPRSAEPEPQSAEPEPQRAEPQRAEAQRAEPEPQPAESVSPFAPRLPVPDQRLAGVPGVESAALPLPTPTIVAPAPIDPPPTRRSRDRTPPDEREAAEAAAAEEMSRMIEEFEAVIHGTTEAFAQAAVQTAAPTHAAEEAAAREALAQVGLAKGIAFVAHRGQEDRVGAAYIDHPGRVAEAFDPVAEPVESAAAWLHDVLERTDLTERELAEAGVAPEVVDVVRVLTRTAEASDDEFYARVARHPLARRVMLADIADEIAPWRLRRLDHEAQQHLIERYRRAKLLLGAE